MRDVENRLFERLFEDSGDAAFLMDPVDDRIVEANPAGCALLGYTREELLECTVSDIHPAEMPELREFLDRALRDGRASTVKLTCRMKSGHFLPTEISIHVVESGDRRYILGLVQDRSEHRRPEP
jgi:chemotaxis family two-component system sensor kinase Cph1